MSFSTGMIATQTMCSLSHISCEGFISDSEVRSSFFSLPLFRELFSLSLKKNHLLTRHVSPQSASPTPLLYFIIIHILRRVYIRLRGPYFILFFAFISRSFPFPLKKIISRLGMFHHSPLLPLSFSISTSKS